MKKPYDHTVGSGIPCQNSCGRTLKINVTIRKPTARTCFSCYREDQAAKGHDMSTAKEVRMGKKPGKKYRETIAERIRREKKENAK